MAHLQKHFQDMHQLLCRTPEQHTYESHVISLIGDILGLEDDIHL
jgi:hypothetical protein